jgi:hypothetical protein
MTTTVKNLLFVVALLLFMAGALYGYYKLAPRPTLPTVATSTPEVVQVVTPAKPIHQTEHAPYYDIDLEYPSSTPISGSAGASAVATMKSFVLAASGDFKTQSNFSHLTPKDIHMIGFDQGEKYTLSGGYDTYTSPTTVSYVFTTSTDTLGAHPNSTYTTFTFDLKTGKALQLADIFLPDSSYLQQLSTLSRSLLTQKLGSSIDPVGFINPGTTPEAKNFKNFAFDGSNLVVFFDPYQVAPYSSGPQTIKIPLSELSSILRSPYSTSTI